MCKPCKYGHLLGFKLNAKCSAIHPLLTDSMNFLSSSEYSIIRTFSLLRQKKFFSSALDQDHNSSSVHVAINNEEDMIIICTALKFLIRFN